jgi:fructan beta-fructosidase
MFYTSRNLLEWKKTSEFGPGVGCLGGVWECPALFSLPLPGPGGGEKWVLLVSLGGGAPNGGSGTEYFIGDFDGERFSSDHASDTAFWLDYGRDNYAAIPFTSMPDTDPRLILVGWMSNWWYAADTPTAPWRGQMTIPREARLVRTVAELAALRQEHQSITNVPLLETTALPQMPVELPGRFELALVVANGEASEWGICLQNSAGEETIIGYDVEGRRLFVNRQRSGNIDFHRDFAGFQHGAKLLAEVDEVALRIYVDWSSIEVCAGEGVVWLSELIFPQQPVSGMTFYARGGQASLQQLDVWTLKSVW